MVYISSAACIMLVYIGAFGCVYKGILTKEMESGTDEVGVAIKTIKSKLILGIYIIFP